MKIHFDNVNFSSRSGPNTFASRLATVLTERGHEIVNYNEDHDTVLVFIEPTRRWHSNKRVVQRLDGIWFKPSQFESHNRFIRWAYDNCDAVIWQSTFDHDMIKHHWGDRPGTVIRNGIDAEKVKLTNRRLKDIRENASNVFVCSANWHRQKRLKENIEAYDILRGGDENACLVVMGSTPDHVVRRPDIFYTNNLKHSLCLEVFSMADCMIHLAWLDHCPNVVIEALSQDCPVICSDSGGTKELVGDGGFIVPETTQYSFELTDYDNPYPIDLNCLKEVKIQDLIVCKDHIDLQKTADQYEKILANL